MGSKSSRSQEQNAWLLRRARTRSICFQWGEPQFTNGTQDTLYVLKNQIGHTSLLNQRTKVLSRSASKYIYPFDFLGCVVFCGARCAREVSSVWCPSVLSGDMSPQRPNFKSECQRNGFSGKGHMIAFCKPGT